MKDFIKYRLREYLLKEQMQSTLDNKFTERGESNLLLVATDNENDKEHYLVLGVDLKPMNGYSELGYGFSIYSKDMNKIGHYMRTRTEVAKYLPIDLKGKITPKINEMVKNLINKFKPNKLYMEQFETISNDNDSFKRFENISNLILSMGYKNKDGYPRKNNLNKWEWVFVSPNNKEESLNEETIFEHSVLEKVDKYKQHEIYYDKIMTKEFLTEWLIEGKITRTDI